MTDRKTGLILGGFFVVLFIVWIAFYFNTTNSQKRSLPVLGNPGHTVDTFTFINQEGRPFTKKDMDGKISVVEYFFTTCTSICPKMNKSLERVYKAYKGNPNVLLLSHTVDPVHDTAGAMKAYSLRFDADPKQWVFLTGDKKRLYEMARYSYLISAQDDTTGVTPDEDFIHDNHFALVDRTGHIRGFYDGLNAVQVDSMIGDIKLLLEEK